MKKKFLEKYFSSNCSYGIKKKQFGQLRRKIFDTKLWVLFCFMYEHVSNFISLSNRGILLLTGRVQFWQPRRQNTKKWPKISSSKSGSGKNTTCLSKIFFSSIGSQGHVECSFDTFFEFFVLEVQKFFNQFPKLMAKNTSFSRPKILLQKFPLDM